jgi:serine/threonine protein kinase/tetratricopeptide (TPR) repeat protein
MIGRTFSHYRIVERLGAGGMGEVYRALDLHLDRDVAIKVLPSGTFHDESARRRFRREAEALSRLNHPHIATVHDFDSADAVDFLVMEYVPGRTLSDRIGRPPLAEKEIAVVGGDVAAALEEAHERGVVHRDLKPANVMVTPKGRAKVLDFGLARLVDVADTAQTTSNTGSAMAGTLPYMAPEQVRGESTDARTDIYALGIVLYEMAAGKRPFDEPHTGRLADAILHAAVPPPSRWQPRLSGELERIILKCLERDPENRYQSAKEVAIDLRRLGAPTTTLPSPTVAAARHRSPKPIAVAAAVAVVALAAAGMVWRGRSDRTSPAATAPDGVASVVALPSKVFAGAADQFMTDAIPNTISAHLSQVKGLETKVPPSSVEVDRVRGDLSTLADAYGVSAFVLSSLTADSDRLVLNVQLVDARSRRLLWSQDFEGRRGNYLALARGAAEQLRGAVRPDAAPVGAQAGTANSQAELAYQRGLHHFNRYNYQHLKADFDQALAALQHALQLDPELADAASAIGWLHEFAIESGVAPEQMLPEVRRWGRRAIDIDERNSRGWALLAVAELIATPPRPKDALEYGLRAAARGPRDPFAVNGTGIALWGVAVSLALVSMEEAARLDPLYLYPPLNSSELLIYLRRHDEALAQAEAVLRLEPGMPQAFIRKALALIELGRAAEARALVTPLRGLAAEGRVEAPYVAVVEDGITLLDGTNEAKRAALGRLAEWALNPSTFAEYPPVYVWLVRHGRTTEALNALERRARVGRVPYDFLRLTPEFDALASDARYSRILAITRAQFDETLSLLGAAEARGELPAFLRQPLADLLQRLGIPAGRRAAAMAPPKADQRVSSIGTAPHAY